MKKISQKKLNERLQKHKLWLENEDGGERLELVEYDLEGSNLSWSNLKGSNLDYSCLPLWCGSLSAHFDDKQLIQIAYHLVKSGLQSKNASEETKAELSKIVDFANKFHRADECGRIEVPNNE